MDIIKNQLARIQEQIGGLSATQKMLAASLVAIMVMTIAFWGRYAGTAELEPVLDQPLSAQDIAQIKLALDSRGIQARVVGDRVMVPASRRLEAVAMLAYAQALPSNSTGAWDEMIKQMSPWDSRTRTEAIQNRMREQMLSRVISEFFPGVAKANVMINPVSERRVGGSLEPSASVIITTRGHDMNVKRLVDAAAATVASAQAGLSRSRVSVVVDGIPRRSQDPSDNVAGSDLYEQIDAYEKRMRDKIIDALGLPNALVAVSVDLEITSSDETSETYDAKTTVSKERVIETTSEESSQPSPQGSEPGAQPNIGLSIAAAPLTPQASSTSEKNRTEFSVFPSRSVRTSHTPSGKPTVVAASVRVPRSFFVNQYKASNANAKDPGDAELQPLLTAELGKIRKQVQACTAMKSEDSISVDTYFDAQLPLLAAVESAGSQSAVGSVVRSYGKELAVGALAVISLFMMSMIVKKGSTGAIPGDARSHETPRRPTQEDVAEVAGEGRAALDGVELDDDTMRAQQLAEQVSTMVSENPDAAANLVKRWLNRT